MRDSTNYMKLTLCCASTTNPVFMSVLKNFPFTDTPSIAGYRKLRIVGMYIAMSESLKEETWSLCVSKIKFDQVSNLL